MMKKPNIVFILTDDQRFNTIHALGNEEIITPNMDWLVYNGTSFTQAHIPGGTSGAVCMPSRAMIHTGRKLFSLQGEGQSIPNEHKTLGETLRENGYFAYGTGKWHNGPPAFTRSFDMGNEIFFGGMWDHWNVPTNYYDPTGQYDNEINFVGNFLQDNTVTKVHCDKFNPGKHSSELLAETSVHFIDEYREDKPFFLYTAFLAPHDPRTMPEMYKKMYDADRIKLPENFTSNPPFFGVQDIRDEVLAAYPRDEKEIREHIAEYYAMITHLDHEIGRIIDAVRRKGELENTIFILAGDNGLAVGCHGLMGKQNHYEHSIRIPLIFSGPGIPKDKQVEKYVYLLDIYPTLCEILGMEVPSSVEGISFAKMFADDTFETRPDLYFAYNDLIRSVKNKQYKLIEYRNYTKKTELFDLIHDPNETTNLAECAEYAEVREELTKLLHGYKDSWGEERHIFGRKYWEVY